MTNLISDQQNKIIRWPTNYNNKLSNKGMIHIDMPPTGPMPETQVLNTNMLIYTDDNSHPPTRWQLIGIARLNLADISDIISIASHGMESFEFIKWFLLTKELTDYYIKVAIYTYRRFEPKQLTDE